MGRKAINQYESFVGEPSEVNVLVQNKNQIDPTHFQHEKSNLGSMLDKKIVQVLLNGDTNHSPSADILYHTLLMKEDVSDISTLKAGLTSFLNNMKTLLTQLVYTLPTNNSYNTMSAIDDLIESMNITYYSVIKSLMKCTMSNLSNIIISGESYTSILTANSGCELTQVYVTMDGVDITQSSYNPSTHTINISSVTGNIMINAIARSIAPVTMYSITKNISGCTLSNNASEIEINDIYNTYVIIDEGYELKSVSITMGGIDITSSSWIPSANAISIDDVTGDIVVNVLATEIIYCSITKNLTNCSLTNPESTVKQGSSYSTNISMSGEYSLDSITVIMNGIDVTESVWDSENNRINISIVTGDIIITANAIQVYSVQTIYENYTSTGTRFYTKDISIDFESGDYVEAIIDASNANVVNNSNVFGVSKNLTSSGGSVSTDNLEFSNGEVLLFFKRSRGSTSRDNFSCRIRDAANGVDITRWWALPDLSDITIRVYKDKLVVNGTEASDVTSSMIDFVTGEAIIALGACSSTRSPDVLYKSIKIYRKS